ncbi:hypothetical protein V8E54_006483 [Elaphomyces granulatus]
MSGNKVFFASQFEGSEVDFAGDHPSKWTLVKKLKEVVLQLDKDNHRSPSSARALFLCVNSNDRSQRAILKVYMQIHVRQTSN